MAMEPPISPVCCRKHQSGPEDGSAECGIPGGVAGPEDGQCGQAAAGPHQVPHLPHPGGGAGGGGGPGAPQGAQGPQAQGQAPRPQEGQSLGSSLAFSCQLSNTFKMMIYMTARLVNIAFLCPFLFFKKEASERMLKFSRILVDVCISMYICISEI